MKKPIKQFFLTVLAIVGLIFLGIGFAIALPFYYIKYKRSLYYKKERRKYITGEAWSDEVEFLEYFGINRLQRCTFALQKCEPLPSPSVTPSPKGKA